MFIALKVQRRLKRIKSSSIGYKTISKPLLTYEIKFQHVAYKYLKSRKSANK